MVTYMMATGELTWSLTSGPWDLSRCAQASPDTHVKLKKKKSKKEEKKSIVPTLQGIEE